MRLLEFQAKEVLSSYGFQIPHGVLIKKGETIPDVKLPCVLKVQIPAGGRGKSGGILFADTEEELKKRIDELFSKRVRGFPVHYILAEEKLNIASEYFISFIIDNSRRKEILIFSDKGGVDIEEVSRTEPDRVKSVVIKPFIGLQDYEVREVLSELSITGKRLLTLTGVIQKLYEVFHSLDATILEINPLVETEDGKFYIADVHFEIEDEALPRHPELKKFTSGFEEYIGFRPMTEIEKKAREIDAMDHRGVAGRFIEFDGNLGLLIGGGGASLTVFDAIRRYGGNPANYCEIGGNPSVKKVAELTKLLLSKPGVERIAVIMNVVSNTRVDLVARGVIKGILESGKDPSKVISVFRIPGAWEDEGIKILEKYGVRYLTREYSLDDAAKIAVGG